MIINSDKIVTSPGHAISILKEQIEIPDKIKLIQKSEIVLVNLKYSITDAYKNKLFKCEGKTTSEKFKIVDNVDNTLYKFELKKDKGDFLQLDINSKNGINDKTVSIEMGNLSIYKNVFTIRYKNEANQEEEVITAYVCDRKTDFYYGGRQDSGGILICECGRYDIEKPVYDIEFAPDVDKTFLFILMVSLTRYVQIHSKAL